MCASQFHLIQDNFLNITALYSQCSGELQSKSCWRTNSRPAVWQQEVGVAVERISAFPTVTFLQNNCPIMTASSRVLCKRVSHFSRLCTVVSGGVKSGKIFFWGKHSAAGVQCYSTQRSLSWTEVQLTEKMVMQFGFCTSGVSGLLQARRVSLFVCYMEYYIVLL